jgi:hypothetical protein
MADQQGPTNPGKRDWKPGGLSLLPTGTNRHSYVRFVERIPDAETRKKLEEMLRAGDFTGVEAVLKSSQRTAQGLSIKDALLDVDIAFRQLEFSIKLLSFCELGHINPSEFDTDHLVRLDEGNLNFPTGKFSDQNSIINAANISVLLAISASVLVLDKAFETAGMRPDPEAMGNNEQLRTLVHMMRCAQAHGIADPRWEVRGKYLRTLTVDVGDLSIFLDLPKLHGQAFMVDQIGGYANWYRIRDVACALIKKCLDDPHKIVSV